MKYIPILILWLWATAAWAQSAMSTISAGVSATTTLSQDLNGSIKVTADVPPQYCVTDAAGTICYY